MLDYNFGNFKLEVTSTPTPVSGGLTPETTSPARPTSSRSPRSTSRTSIPTDPGAKFDRLAGLIVNNLRSPDIVALEEIQDNNGPTDDGTVDADAHLRPR